MEGLDDCPAAHLEALLHAPHPRSLLIPHLAHHQLRSLHGAGVGRRLGRSGENCTYNVGRRGWSSYLPLPSSTAPRSIPAPEIGFLKTWSSVSPIIWRYLQCLRETESGRCCLYHPCPPQPPPQVSTGLASRHATLVPLLLLACNSRVLISQDTDTSRHSASADP